MKRSSTTRFLFRLALKLGWINPHAMARRMPAKLLHEWIAYAMVEPWDETRDDYRTAQVVQMLYNINRDSKKEPHGRKLEEFLLIREDEDVPKSREQPVEEKMRVMQLIMKATAMAAAESAQPLPQTHEHQYPQLVIPEQTSNEQQALMAARAAMKDVS